MGFVSLFAFLILMVIPVVGGVMLIVLGRKRGRGFPACGKCGYDVTGTLGTTNARCPECGSDFGIVGITPAVSQSNKPAVVAGVVLIALPLMCFGGLMITSYTAMSRARTAMQAAQAAAAQQQTLAQQMQLATSPADPAMVAAFRARLAGLSSGEASQRLSAVTQELAQRQSDQSLTEDSAANLRAEMQALIDHLAELSGAPEPSPSAPQPN